MDTPTTAVVLEGQFRTLMAVLGGILVAHGYIDNATLAEGTGALMALIPFVWSAWGHIKRAREAKAKIVEALNVGIAVSNAEPNITPPVPAAAVPAIIAAVAPTLPVVVEEPEVQPVVKDSP